MASKLKNLSKYDDKNMPSAAGMRIGIVCADYHNEITHKLYQGCVDTFVKHGVAEDAIFTAQVPGAFELPTGAKFLAAGEKMDAIVCIGCVIKGETSHNDYINQATANAITTLSVMSGMPVVYGVLTPNNMEQAQDRAGGKHGNKGVEAAVTAIRMVALKKDLKNLKSKIGFGA